jgi:hypothetical protein
MRTVVLFGYAGQTIDKVRTAMHAIWRFLEGKMPLLKRSNSLASYRSQLVHGETYKMSKEDAASLLRKLKDDKKRRSEKKRELEHARQKSPA